MNVVNSIMETVGATPLLRLNNLSAFANLAGEVLVKMESMNPGGSVKDRIALNMIQKAVAEGLLTKNRVLLEATSGNTGIGLAMVAASLGFGIVLVMPETMSVERRKLLRAYGADILLTPGSEAM
jgi:cysteine synthase A